MKSREPNSGETPSTHIKNSEQGHSSFCYKHDAKFETTDHSPDEFSIKGF